MHMHNPLLTPGDDLLRCRAAMLGVDLAAPRDDAMVETMTRRCARCEWRATCELDLERDPNDPVWETYCPNTAALIALA
jgi:hypothetical protein